MNSSSSDSTRNFCGETESKHCPGDVCGSASGSCTTVRTPKSPSDYVWNHGLGCKLLDDQGNPITIENYLNTKPIRGDLSTRPGPGGRKLTYLSGDVVTRTLNEVFGYDGWSLSIITADQLHAIDLNEKENNKPSKWQVSYISHVRINLTRRAAFREDYGMGDSIDKSLPTAIGNALKASITDGMKRAARLFGEKLGNSLYDSKFSLSKAPNTFAQALREYKQSQETWQRQFQSCQKTTTQTTNVAAKSDASSPFPQQHSKVAPQMQLQKDPTGTLEPTTTKQSSARSKEGSLICDVTNSKVVENPSNHVKSTMSAPHSRQGQTSGSPSTSQLSASSSQATESLPTGDASAFNQLGNTRHQTSQAFPCNKLRNGTTSNMSNVSNVTHHQHLQKKFVHVPRVSDASEATAVQPVTRNVYANSSLPHPVPAPPRVSDVTASAPLTAAENIQSIFSTKNACAEETDQSWKIRPPTATGKRPSSSISHAANKMQRGISNAHNPYH